MIKPYITPIIIGVSIILAAAALGSFQRYYLITAHDDTSYRIDRLTGELSVIIDRGLNTHVHKLIIKDGEGNVKGY